MTSRYRVFLSAWESQGLTRCLARRAELHEYALSFSLCDYDFIQEVCKLRVSSELLLNARHHLFNETMNGNPTGLCKKIRVGLVISEVKKKTSHLPEDRQRNYKDYNQPCAKLEATEFTLQVKERGRSVWDTTCANISKLDHQINDQ
jgi:hypothetical protein